ncbi:oxidoreductase [Paracoccus aminophilus]|uniref:NADH:flavin oxidoreductase n=1 Tax=Paracoccus aminophilus JCM 7686 TaxID=1367847 RepID=S5YUA6_PARAH|nr:NADH:flavin oxidoreductase [Paracoccus aminophilus]AGT08826.1 NADH:flavin oxidoreductase [Paracoccus aminophilus JCM 7686]
MQTTATINALQRYAAVTAPFTVRGVRFRNRVFLSAMGLDMAESDGCMSPDLIEFYRGVIAGGVGAVMLSNASVSRESALLPRALKMHDSRHAAALRPFFDEAAQANVVVGVQLQHYGGQGATTLTSGHPLLTPSGIGCQSSLKLDPNYRVRAMEAEDFDRVQAEFAQGARLAVAAGARFVQLQASNGYLLSSFLSKFTNRREDDWGGDPLRRARFVIEVVEAVRAAIGPEVVLGLRIGLNDYLGAGGLELADLEPVVPRLEAAGVDLFEASFCVADTFSRLSQNTPELRAELAAQVRQFREWASVPVGFAGFIGSLQESCDLIEAGVVDYVALARALLADNDLIRKELAGRESEVHRCRWDGACFRDKYNPQFQRVHCCVNPKYKRPSDGAKQLEGAI